MFHTSRFLKSAILFLGLFTMPVSAKCAEVTAPGARVVTENDVRCGSHDPDIAIAGCTALIESGLDTGSILAAIYQLRGIAHYNKGLTDQAIADQTSVIGLRPDFAGAYYVRGEAYLKKRHCRPGYRRLYKGDCSQTSLRRSLL